jgi:DNA-binding MarR family transcriptional regulator
MGKVNIYAFEMSRIAEVYLSTLSAIMKPQGLERYFVPLIYLTENSGAISQKDLSDAIRRDKVFTMRVVDYLSERGLLVRKQDCNDRRCQILEVTDKGKALVPIIKEGIAKTDALLFHDFTTEEKAIFKSGIDKLFATINTLPDPEFIVHAYKRNKK